MAYRSILMTLLLSVAFAEVAAAQEWTRFRGPNGQGISAAIGIPVQWTDKDYRWEVETAGRRSQFTGGLGQTTFRDV